MYNDSNKLLTKLFNSFILLLLLLLLLLL